MSFQIINVPNFMRCHICRLRFLAPKIFEIYLYNVFAAQKRSRYDNGYSSAGRYSAAQNFNFKFRDADEIFKEFFEGKDPFEAFFGDKDPYKAFFGSDDPFEAVFTSPGICHIITVLIYRKHI